MLSVEGVGRYNCEAPLSNLRPIAATVGAAEKLEKANVISIFKKGKKSPFLPFPVTLGIVNYCLQNKEQNYVHARSSLDVICNVFQVMQ